MAGKELKDKWLKQRGGNEPVTSQPIRLPHTEAMILDDSDTPKPRLPWGILQSADSQLTSHKYRPHKRPNWSQSTPKYFYQLQERKLEGKCEELVHE